MCHGMRLKAWLVPTRTLLSMMLAAAAQEHAKLKGRDTGRGKAAPCTCDRRMHAGSAMLVSLQAGSRAQDIDAAPFCWLDYLHRGLDEQPVGHHRASLADAVHACNGLLLHRRVHRALQKPHAAGCTHRPFSTLGAHWQHLKQLGPTRGWLHSHAPLSKQDAVPGSNLHSLELMNQRHNLRTSNTQAAAVPLRAVEASRSFTCILGAQKAGARRLESFSSHMTRHSSCLGLISISQVQDWQGEAW